MFFLVNTKFVKLSKMVGPEPNLQILNVGQQSLLSLARKQMVLILVILRMAKSPLVNMMITMAMEIEMKANQQLS